MTEWASSEVKTVFTAFQYMQSSNIVWRHWLKVTPSPPCQVSAEVLEGSSGEDEVEDETFGRIFSRSRTRRGEEFFPFPRPFRGRDEEFLGISAFFSAILRTRLLILVFRGRGRDEARNFASFLGHFEVEARPSRTSGKEYLWSGSVMTKLWPIQA